MNSSRRIKHSKNQYNSLIVSDFHDFLTEFVRKAYEFVALTIKDIVSQLEKSLKSRKRCQCLSLRRFKERPEWILIEIDVKSDKKRNKSLISQSKKDSAASSELNKSLFSFLSAVESSGIEEAKFN